MFLFLFPQIKSASIATKTVLYKVLLIGLDVMAQVPEEQPIFCQYKKPAIAPSTAPINFILFLLIHFNNYPLLGARNIKL